MPLLLQVGGVLAAAYALLALVGGRTAGRIAVPPLPALIAAVAAALAIGAVWPTASRLLDQRESGARLTAAQAEAAGGLATGQPVAGLDAIRGRLAPGETFAVVPGGRRGDPTRYQWTLYQLSPHRAVGPAAADWLVLYGAPAAVGYDRGRFGAPIPVAPQLWLVPRAGAG